LVARKWNFDKSIISLTLFWESTSAEVAKPG
jgi:hypothetical protein